ncbi:unnamed protein product [Strongylus vulgaris]|uniref:Kelch repeat protein n=1 Tax=Strongylus vulgaris TaxID=40348 RepID=A0A3P7J1U5_STRVU|nr:unnamed protein product [Strongylus vulgaris]
MTKQRSAAGVAVLDGYLYVMGGHDGMSIFSSVERFSPEKGQWEAVPSMLSKRCRLGATTLNGKIYVCGGTEPYSNKVEWKFCACMVLLQLYPESDLEARVNHAFPFLQAGCVVQLRKLSSKSIFYDGAQFLNSVECFDPTTMRWTPVTPMNIKRSRVSLVANANAIYAIAG